MGALLPQRAHDAGTTRAACRAGGTRGYGPPGALTDGAALGRLPMVAVMDFSSACATAGGAREARRALIVAQLRPRLQRACAHFAPDEFERLLERMTTIRLAWEAADAEPTVVQRP